ncbi:MAG: hypothetical protein KF754_12385 [Planctomycetes bacterium]|nr:hypothetical protein [Planctomycetota bacterium]
MSFKLKSKDPDIRGSYPALKRAAKRAMQRAIATGTPLYVMQGGKIVNLNPAGKLARKNTA